jgi:hypothetical protein
VGHILPGAVGDRITTLLNNPTELDDMRTALKAVRGEPGAAKRLAALVQQVLGDFLEKPYR